MIGSATVNPPDNRGVDKAERHVTPSPTLKPNRASQNRAWGGGAAAYWAVCPASRSTKTKPNEEHEFC